MIGIILNILKIIGIIILAILGIVILLLALTLFVPFRYDISGHYYDKEDYKAEVRCSYLLHIISFSLSYEKELASSLKLFGIKMDLSAKAKEDETENEVDSKEKDSENKKKKANKEEKSGNVLANLKSFSEEHNLDYVIHFLIDQLVYLLNELAPRKVKLDLDLGFTNPAYTGWTVAGLSMVSWIYNDGVNITPYFNTDENIVKGSTRLKGRIRLVVLVIILCRVLFDKEVKRTLLDLSKVGGSNGK